MATRCINYNDIESFLLELGDTLCSNGYRICLGVRTEVSDLCFRCRLSGLVEGTCTEGVGADDAGFEAAL